MPNDLLWRIFLHILTSFCTFGEKYWVKIGTRPRGSFLFEYENIYHQVLAGMCCSAEFSQAMISGIMIGSDGSVCLFLIQGFCSCFHFTRIMVYVFEFMMLVFCCLLLQRCDSPICTSPIILCFGSCPHWRKYYVLCRERHVKYLFHLFCSTMRNYIWRGRLLKAIAFMLCLS